MRALHFALTTGVLCGAIASLINALTIMAVGVLGSTYRVPKVTPTVIPRDPVGSPDLRRALARPRFVIVADASSKRASAIQSTS